MTVLPAITLRLPATFRMLRSARPLTGVVTAAVLLIGFGSGVWLPTMALFARLPLASAGTETWIEKEVAAPAARSATGQTNTFPGFNMHVPALTTLTVAGNVSVTTTPTAFDGP